MDFSNLTKQHKKKPLADFDSTYIEKVNYLKADIIKIIPNRDPFLFIDKISGIDLTNKIIIGERKIAEDDPVFKGHFPGFPVYPGALQLEMISEIFSCLYYFVSNNTVKIINNKTVNLRAIRMHDALLQYGLFPGDEVKIVGKVIENNSLTYSCIGQIIKGNEISVIVIGDFYIVE